MDKYHKLSHYSMLPRDLKAGVIPASLSGSETDMSSTTSNENLTVEENQALINGIRQEPQGEERLSTELTNTLIIHSNNPYSEYLSPFYSKESFLKSNQFNHHNYQSNSRDGSSSGSPIKSSPPKQSYSPIYSPPLSESSGITSDFSVQEITEIPKHYLDNSEVLKHLAKEVHHQLPPSPKRKSESRNSIRKSGLGRFKSNDSRMSLSHPDLTNLDNLVLSNVQSKVDQRTKILADALDIDPTNKEMLNLSLENYSLRQELTQFTKKITRLQKFEIELHKVYQAYKDLVSSSEKREKLERAVRNKLETEVRKLQEQNKNLQEEVENLQPSNIFHRSSTDDNSLAREVLIGQLLQQNKELMTEKERQDIELHAQRATLQEQRNHITILDSALMNTQTNVVKLEEDLRKKQTYVDRVTQLQKALENLQFASDRRVQMEKKLRAQLEKEIEANRAQKPGQQSDCKNCKTKPGAIEEMKKRMREYDEKIISLETEVSKWEQKYIEESAMRQMAVDAASLPKDARIAALEKTAQDCEKLIAQSRADQLRHMDELYASQRKVAELEGKLKDMESKLAEREAMICVLQNRMTNDKSSSNSIISNWPRHLRSASTVGISTVGSTPLHSHSMLSREDLVGVSARLSTIPTSSASSTSELDVTKQLNLQLKEYEARNNSKDSLISVIRAQKERHPSHCWQV